MSVLVVISVFISGVAIGIAIAVLVMERARR